MTGPGIGSLASPRRATCASLITHAPSFPPRVTSHDLGRKSTARIGHIGQILVLFAP